MREIDLSSTGSSSPELNETVLATLDGPESPEFKALRKQHPASRFDWHSLSDPESPKLAGKRNARE